MYIESPELGNEKDTRFWGSTQLSMVKWVEGRLVSAFRRI